MPPIKTMMSSKDLNEELESKFVQNNIHIGMLQETWFRRKNLKTMDGYNVIRDDRKGKRGGDLC